METTDRARSMHARPRASRHVTAATRLTAVAASLAVMAAMLLLATPATAARHWKHCGFVQTDVRVLASGTSCTKARAVARARFNGHRNPRGFSCRRVAVEAGAGYFVRCRKGSALVKAIPE
jgi:hypothetical protein